MEEGMMQNKDFSFELLLDQYFELPSRDWKQYSPLTLAYLGDTVFDLVIRTMLVKKANMPTAALHRKASGYVNARSQVHKALKTSEPKETWAKYEKHIYDNQSKIMHIKCNLNHVNYLTF